MSKVSTVYDTLVSTLGTLFPSKTRVPDPYSLPDNKLFVLKDGYGLRYEGEDLIPGEFNTLAKEYQFSVVFCRELVRMDSEVDAYDTLVKAMLEDVATLRKDAYDVDKMGLGDDADLITLGSTSSIENVFPDKNNVKSVETLIIVQVRELTQVC